MIRKKTKGSKRDRSSTRSGMPTGWWIVSFIVALLFAAGIGYYLLDEPEFNGASAFQYLEKQCEFGPRVPGSDAHRACGDYLVRELGKYSDRVLEQHFEYTDRGDSTVTWPGRNIVASFNLSPGLGYRVMLCAHWDCRPFADQDPDSSRWSEPVMGANDAASGVAVLLEMAQILSEHPLDFGVDIVLFDLEDMGEESEDADSVYLNPYCIGSEYFAENNPQYRPKYGVLLDMIGDRDLAIPREQISDVNAPALMNRIWRSARAVEATAFIDAPGDAVNDDHVPFLRRGIPVVDLIDFDYEYWHTTEDTPDKCNAESLQQVGDVLVHLLYKSED